jgi:hypothetical protein
VKQRDAEIGARIGFALRAVRIGADRQGRALTSCVVERAGVTEVAFEREALSPNAARTLRLLRDLIESEGKVEPGVSGDHRCVELATLRDKCMKSLPGETEAARKRAYQRAVRELEDNGHVAKVGAFVWPA